MKGLAITYVTDEHDATVLNEVQKRFEVQITGTPDEVDVAKYSIQNTPKPSTVPTLLSKQKSTGGGKATTNMVATYIVTSDAQDQQHQQPTMDNVSIIMVNVSKTMDKVSNNMDRLSKVIEKISHALDQHLMMIKDIKNNNIGQNIVSSGVAIHHFPVLSENEKNDKLI
ncbi:unnamed protein product [Adineta steineri]|uniref:Uncharacterized protein n=1 Tax=Adineta steineri TaxID=433720 RepID=A0A818QQC9_9BILA|nr:unnamed protein product [Adineta steineri]CAF3644741.1 unnamed protein product [Adineta steineri]